MVGNAVNTVQTVRRTNTPLSEKSCEGSCFVYATRGVWSWLQELRQSNHTDKRAVSTRCENPDEDRQREFLTVIIAAVAM